MTALEAIAALFGLAGVILAILEWRSTWLAYSVSCLVYIPVHLEGKLYLYSGLQVVFTAFAVHAWFAWGRTGARAVVIASAPLSAHLWTCLLTAAAVIPYAYWWAEPTLFLAGIDAFISFASIGGMILAAKKYYENWVYWLVINVFAVYLFIEQRLYPTTVLYVTYLTLSVVGYYSWRAKFRRALAVTTNQAL